MKVHHHQFILVTFILLLSCTRLLAQPETELNIIKFDDFKASLNAEREKPMVVDFWASWCGPCVYSMPELKTLENKWGPRGIEFVSVSWDKNPNQGVAAAKKLRMTWSLIFPRSEGEVAFLDEKFPHKSIPTLFLVYPNGKIKKVSLEKLDSKLSHFDKG